MSTLLVAIGAFFGFIVAYHTYGRWLSRRIFNLDAQAVTPSHELMDGVFVLEPAHHKAAEHPGAGSDAGRKQR